MNDIGMLSGKTVLITGGSRGIGRACALQFAERGARVAIHFGSNRAAAEEALAQLPGEGHIALQADIRDPAAVAGTVDHAVSSFGRLDVLVNNAGLGAVRPVPGTPLATWERMLAVNLTGTFLPTKHVWKLMQAQGGGSIINIASLAGRRGVALMSAYAASKWGQIGFTLSAAEEGKAHGIRVNAVAPGKGDTAMRAAVVEDKAKLLRAEDHIGVCVFLASDEARYITGQVVEIDWFGKDGHGSAP